MVFCFDFFTASLKGVSFPEYAMAVPHWENTAPLYIVGNRHKTLQLFFKIYLN